MKRIVFMAMAMLVLLSLTAGCNQKPPMEVITNDNEEEETQATKDGTEAEVIETKLNSIVYPDVVDFSNEEMMEYLEANEVDEGTVDAVSEFSVRSSAVLLGGESGNTCYSPLSLYMALALLSTGAEGETQDELLALLGEEDAAVLSEQMGKLYRTMYRDTENSTFIMTNSLWMNGEYEFNEEFVGNAMDNFYAAANTLDFSDEGSADVLTDWISDNTNGLLKPKFTIDPMDLMYIINTVYLKDEWTESFDEELTKEDVFKKADGSEVLTDFMRNNIDAQVIYGNGFTAVTLYLRSTGNMTFVLPDEGVDLSELLSSTETIASMTDKDNAEYAMVNLSLPKFSFESEFNLKQALMDLGVNKVFSMGEADLGGIIDQQAYVSSVKQGTDITVNENGLEAAAYTKVDIALTAAYTDNEPIVMTFDRPFLYLVQSRSGVPVFVGSVQNPAN